MDREIFRLNNEVSEKVQVIHSLEKEIERLTKENEALKEEQETIGSPKTSVRICFSDGQSIAINNSFSSMIAEFYEAKQSGKGLLFVEDEYRRAINIDHIEAIVEEGV